MPNHPRTARAKKLAFDRSRKKKKFASMKSKAPKDQGGHKDLRRGYKNGGKTPTLLKKKGPATDKIKNNRANLEARKLNASGLLGNKYERRYSAGVGKNMYANKKLQPSGYKPKPKAAPRPLRKIKGYDEWHSHKTGKIERDLPTRSKDSNVNRDRVWKDKQAAKKNRRKYKKGGFLKNMGRTPFGKGLLEAGSQMGGVMGMLSARKQAKQAASEAGLTGKDAKRAIRRQTFAGMVPGAIGAGLRKGLGAKDMANPTGRGNKEGVLVENGGRVPKGKKRKMTKSMRPKRMEKMSDKAQVGAPSSNKFIKDLQKRTRGSIGDLELRATTGKTAAQMFKAGQKSREVPNPGLGKKTEDFGRMGKRTYSSGNPGGLKGRTKGKGGNVGHGMTAKKKRRRRR